MAITNYLVHFKTNETFESNKDQLRNDAVAFVGDATIIHTHGTDYYCGSGPVALKSDLSKYATTSALTSGLAGKANTLHTHTISQVSGLQAELDSKLESADLSGYALKTDIPSLSGGASATSGQYVSGVTVSGHKITVTKATLPSVSLSSLGITATAEEINKLDGITATTQELNYVDGVTSNIQTQLNNKAASSHNHSAANITSGTLDLARIPTGTTSSTVALGNHTHSNYLTSSSLSGYATQSWVQSQGYLTSVPAQSWSSITGKPSSFTPSSHTHPISQVTERGKLTFTGAATGTYDGSGNLTINIPAGGGGAGSIAWNDITGKPSTFTPAAHTHGSNDVTALTGYSEGSSTTTLSASMSLNAALASLQNQIQTKQAAGSYAAASHTHTASQVSGLAKVATSGSYNDLTNKPSIPSAYTLPVATASVLGGVKIGSGVTISSGVISVSCNSIGAATSGHTHSQYLTSSSLSGYATQSWVNSQGFIRTAYTLPTASASTLGGVKIGSGVNISNGVISVTTSSIGAATSSHTHSQYLTSSSLSGYATQSWVNSQGFIKSATDTKNTAGSTNTSSKLFLIGATSQAANPVTYSNGSVYTQSGQLYATQMNATSGFYETSDARLKNFNDDIKALEVVSEIPTKYFTWKSDESKTEHIGTSAQEIQKLYPDLVTENEDGVLSVDYARLSIIALAAIKELKAQIDELKSKIN